MDEPHWLGSTLAPDRPLATRWHLPADRLVRGAVVLCPPVGYEYALSHHALRVLADGLAGAGLAAVRLDYDGTGDSWGDDLDPGRVAAWSASVVLAAGAVRERLGVPVALAGLRLGAILAAAVADDLDAAALALWDPIVSGRQYVRRLRALAGVQGQGLGPGSITVDGTVVTEETLADLGALELTRTSRPTLAVLREGRAVPDVLAQAEIAHHPGQEEMLGADTLGAAVPAAAVAALVGWLAARPWGTPTPAGPAADLGSTADLVTAVDGVRETFVRYVGMAGVLTEPAHPTRRPTVVLPNTSVDPHSGPSRAWTTWARQLADQGFRTLRADLTGLGDSPARPGAQPQRPYGPSALHDVAALAAAADEGYGVVLAGLCSGARNALDAAALEATALDAAAATRVTDLLVVNPPLSMPRAQLEQVAPGRGNPAATDEVSRRRRLRHAVASRLPGAAWWAVHHLGLLEDRTRSLHAAVDGGTEVLLVYSAGDYVLLQPAANARWAMADLTASGRFTVREIEADHALFDPAGRRAALEVMTAHLLARYPPAPATVVGRQATRR